MPGAHAETTTTTTAAPAATSTAAPAATTTAAPAATTTAAPAATTTAAPAATTTAPPPPTTTTAPPAATTTAPPPGSTTTAAPGDAPAVEEVTVDIDPDDGADHHAHSIQVKTDAKLTLRWTTRNATGVRIEQLGQLDASGSSEIPAKDDTYSIIALGSGGAESSPYQLEIHTHAPDEVVSAHVEIGSGVAKILSFLAQVDGTPASSAAQGASLELQVVVSDGVEAVTIEGQEVELTDKGDGHKTGSNTVTAPTGQDTVSYTCKASKGGAEADSTSLTVTLEAAPGTTTTAAAPSSTTTAPGTTTTAPSTTTTAPPTTTTASGEWTAAWSEESVCDGKTLQMQLTAPGLQAGTEVTFEVTLEGMDTPLGQVTATAEEGKATADWSTWFKPEAVKDQQTLDGDQGEKFQEVKFSFKASAGGKDASSTSPATYADKLSLALTDPSQQPHAKTRLAVHTPWGTLTITTGEDGSAEIDGLPPGGAHVSVLGPADGVGTTTTAAPNATTTAAPSTTTTAAPNATTTAAPNATTTAAPNATTTAAPNATTTAAPNATTTAAPGAWTAAWGAQQATEDAKVQMVLTAPGLKAGTEVTFEVKQDGVDAPIGQVTATAEEGKATADWSAWFKPEAVGGQQSLDADNGDKFKEAKFSFKASAGGQEATTTDPLTFADTCEVTVVDASKNPVPKAVVLLVTPWGSIRATADDNGHVVFSGLPPGPAHAHVD